ncbi:unnamed protein product, partial [Aphanomyces euteiches]
YEPKAPRSAKCILAITREQEAYWDKHSKDLANGACKIQQQFWIPPVYHMSGAEDEVPRVASRTADEPKPRVQVASGSTSV